MTKLGPSKIVKHQAPGELRAAALDPSGRAFSLFIQRWNGHGEPARFGSTHTARLRTFADDLAGAFLTLASGEDAFMRLRNREGFTEGMELSVRVVTEWRQDKLARVAPLETVGSKRDAFETWCHEFGTMNPESVEADHDTVSTAFDIALTDSVTLPGGGRLHVDRTRALTAFDVDTSGRTTKGSAGARSLAVNRDAVAEMARQVSLRNLGGNLVLDCVGPLNKSAGDLVHAACKTAFEAVGLTGVKVLRPSPLGLLEVSVPWRHAPIDDVLRAQKDEGVLLGLMRDVQREVHANPTALYQLALSKNVWATYLQKRRLADDALRAHFGGRVSVIESLTDQDRIQKK